MNFLVTIKTDTDEQTFIAEENKPLALDEEVCAKLQTLEIVIRRNDTDEG